jgi:hypothetical protein
MKQDEILKIFGIIVVCFFIIYITIQIVYHPKKTIEGLTNEGETVTPSNGVAGSAASYAAAIKAEVVKLQDELLISKYRKDYEAAIINLDELIGYQMLKSSLSLNTAHLDNLMPVIMIEQLKLAREGLNATMAFLDKQ